jgi:hypothetical protein
MLYARRRGRVDDEKKRDERQQKTPEARSRQGSLLNDVTEAIWQITQKLQMPPSPARLGTDEYVFNAGSQPRARRRLLLD